jgi:hypothetical protein
MSEQEANRTAKWRERQVEKGGKPIGITLTPEAKLALESIQGQFNWSQREAVSRALEFASKFREQLFALSLSREVIFDTLNPKEIKARIEAMERKLEELDRVNWDLREKLDDLSGQSSPLDKRKFTEEQKRLLDFTAKQFVRYGENVSRYKLFDLAKQLEVPVHMSSYEYENFVTSNLDVIRDMVKTIQPPKAAY